MQIFDFSLPIGWDELGTISTVLALITALYANHNAYVQLKKSMQIHEQSKSVSLFDQRIEVIEALRKKSKVPLVKIRLLYNEDIAKAAQKYYVCFSEFDQCQQKENNFWTILDTNFASREEKEQTEKKLRALRDKLLQQNKKENANPGLVKQFKELCDKNVAVCTLEDTGEDIEMNFYNIYDKLPTAKKAMKESHAALIEKMEKFIEQSIAVIS